MTEGSQGRTQSRNQEAGAEAETMKEPSLPTSSPMTCFACFLLPAKTMDPGVVPLPCELHPPTSKHYSSR